MVMQIGVDVHGFESLCTYDGFQIHYMYLKLVNNPFNNR